MIYRFLPYSIILGCIFLDQVTKKIAQTSITYSYEVTSFLKLVTVYNKGVSFGMLGGGMIPSWVFIIFTICVCLFLFFWLKKEQKNRLAQIALSLIIGGALSNAFDRATQGAVFDFLYFHIQEYYWPAFNLADSCIVIGVGLLFFQNLTKTKISSLKKG